MRDAIATHLSHLAAARHSHLDLKQSFKATLQTLFKFKSLSEADVGSVIPAPYHQGAIIYYTQSSAEAGLLEAQSGHNNLGFSLIHTPTHDKRALLQATKAINRAFPAYNILFFLSQDHLSIAFATRRAAKNRIEQTDVLEKITLIKDISLHSPHPAHIRNLESIANLHHSAIDEYYQSILATLSIEKLNEAFFTEIKGHFLEFCESCTLPMENPTEAEKSVDSTKEANSNTKREFVLRLISRLLFCKFLEKKGLIDPKIWDCNLSEEYYHNVCEPLFFTTLNTKAEERDYGLLPEPITILLDSIPYLNGGLFSPQDCDFFTPKNPNAYINTLKIPNDCFTKLFATFDNYHFTLSESTPLSQEVGLDPELLGMVFENLLSVLFTDNKKNDKDLRKATGSYYTPREIVSYMCNASLLECLKERLSLDEQRLEQLVFEKRNHFNAEESGQILTTLESLKILDPACGSGAFPMGMLHEMLEIQEALIEDSAWGNHSADVGTFSRDIADHLSSSPLKSVKSYESNTANLRMLEENVESQANSSHSQSITNTQSSNESKTQGIQQGKSPQAEGFLSDFVGFTPKGLHQTRGEGSLLDVNNQALSEESRKSTKKPTLYNRKLKILQTNIYGVDIQPMATEIARLRCFLSLICDAPNDDIKPLPNLEFKFLTANSLIPLPKQEGLSYNGYEADMAELRSLREQTFNASDKKALESAYLALRDKIAKNIINAWGVHKGDFSSNPLLSWNPFNPHSVAEFFDSEWMFGIPANSGGGAIDDIGFDIIIGNPPYGADISKGDKVIYKSVYKHTITGSLDSYKFFIELGFNLLSIQGILSFITPISVTSSKSNIALHKLLLSHCKRIIVSSYGNAPARIFTNADQRVSIITFLKTQSPCEVLLTTQVNLRDKHTSIKDVIDNLCFINSLEFAREGEFAKIGLEIEKDILHKLYTQKIRLKSLMAGDERVYYRDTGGRYYDLYTSYSTTQSTTQKYFAAIDSKMLVAIMSSTLFWWFRNAYSEGRHSYLYEFESFPIPYFNDILSNNFVNLGTKYEQDLELNAAYHNGVKTYYIRKSKRIIDEIDSLLCPLYGLDKKEVDFIINFNLKFRG